MSLIRMWWTCDNESTIKDCMLNVYMIDWDSVEHNYEGTADFLDVIVVWGLSKVWSDNYRNPMMLFTRNVI